MPRTETSMDPYQSYTLGSIIEHIAPISTKRDKTQKPTKCTVCDPEMAMPLIYRKGPKKTYILQSFGEFANRKKEQIFGKKSR